MMDYDLVMLSAPDCWSGWKAALGVSALGKSLVGFSLAVYRYSLARWPVGDDSESRRSSGVALGRYSQTFQYRLSKDSKGGDVG